jgi:ATP-dependent protease ClpP protease subunit
METEGFAIYDTMMLVKNEVYIRFLCKYDFLLMCLSLQCNAYFQIQTVAVGAAIGQACLLLAAGTKGRRYMMPHATGMYVWMHVCVYAQDFLLVKVLYC